MLNNNRIPIKGITNFKYLLNGTSTMARVAKTNPVGVMNEIKPKPN